MVEATAWPQGYRERNELQDNSFKGLLDHGALNTHDGRQQMVGPDRHQQRAPEQRDKSLEGLQPRVDKRVKKVKAPQDKGAESAATGHGPRLEQRQRTLAVLDKARKDAQHQQGQRAAQAAALGPPGERAERACRQQTSRTFRTLLLENALTSFITALVGHLQAQGSVACLLSLLCERSGSRVEPGSQVMYWVNAAGFSVTYRRLLGEVVDGLCAMHWRSQGKPIRVCLRDMPP